MKRETSLQGIRGVGAVEFISYSFEMSVGRIMTEQRVKWTVTTVGRVEDIMESKILKMQRKYIIRDSRSWTQVKGLDLKKRTIIH